MLNELKLFLDSKCKIKNENNYTFNINGYNFSLSETPCFLNLTYSYIGERTIIEPDEIHLDRNITLQHFSQEIIRIIEMLSNHL